MTRPAGRLPSVRASAVTDVFDLVAEHLLRCHNLAECVIYSEILDYVFGSTELAIVIGLTVACWCRIKHFWQALHS